MKKILTKAILITATLIFVSGTNSACDFHFQIENPKTSYSMGDEVVITVSVVLTHRVCKVELDETKFSASGMQIIGATQWVQLSDRIYARKLKIKITDDVSSGTKLTAIRDCEKDGGKGSLTL